MSKGISSVEGLIRKVFKITCDSDRVMFYRGHSNKEEYKLEPSLYRKDNWKRNEHALYSELIAANPTEFSPDVCTFERLVRMQHHSLPTRLLDITTNPLMALYFSCDPLPGVNGEVPREVDGEVIFLKIKKQKMKYFDSDAVSCVSNLARLTDAEKQQINTVLDKSQFNTTNPIPRLLHFIKQEKPYFLDLIEPKDLRDIFCVQPKLSNSRIIFQSGAFLLFGLSAILEEEGNENIQVERVAISKHHKEKIRQELSLLNINVATVYPLLDNSAKFLSDKFK